MSQYILIFTVPGDLLTCDGVPHIEFILNVHPIAEDAYSLISFHPAPVPDHTVVPDDGVVHEAVVLKKEDTIIRKYNTLIYTLSRMMLFRILTPSPILQFAPIVTLGPILAD